MPENKLKNKIKVYRAINGMTQEQLSVKTGVTRKTINTIESGKFVPSAVLAIRIARCFGVAVEEIFELEE